MRFHTLQVIKKNLGSTVAGENKREKFREGRFYGTFCVFANRRGTFLMKKSLTELLMFVRIVRLAVDIRYKTLLLGIHSRKEQKDPFTPLNWSKWKKYNRIDSVPSTPKNI